MVSKASEDLPEPESPVKTTSWSRGISRSTPLRLCSRAPRIAITRRSLAWAAARGSGRRARDLSSRSFIGCALLAFPRGRHRAGVDHRKKKKAYASPYSGARANLHRNHAVAARWRILMAFLGKKG